MPLTIKSDRFHWSASWPMTLLTVAAFAGFIRLGIWQWHRAQFKTAQLAQFNAGAQAVTPLDAGAAAGAAVAGDAETLPRYAVVRASGRYDPSHQFVLENISEHGLPGYEVLTPFALADGRTLMVNRGWLPASGTRSQLPDIAMKSDPASAPATVTGRLDNLPVVGIALGHIPPSDDDHWPKLTAFPTMADLSNALRRPLQSRQLLLDPGEPEGFQREWQLAGLGPGRHLAYAIQWWGFAALALVLYAALNRHRRRA